MTDRKYRCVSGVQTAGSERGEKCRRQDGGEEEQRSKEEQVKSDSGKCSPRARSGKSGPS